MPYWERIVEEGQQLAQELRRRQVDLSEVEKAIDFYVRIGCDEDRFRRYLELMAKNPPVRSKKTKAYYQNLFEAWNRWTPSLQGLDKARAAGWAVRLAKVGA